MSETNERNPVTMPEAAEDKAIAVEETVENIPEENAGNENEPRGEAEPAADKPKKKGKKRRKKALAVVLMAILLVIAVVFGAVVGYTYGRSLTMERLEEAEKTIAEHVGLTLDFFG